MTPAIDPALAHSVSTRSSRIEESDTEIQIRRAAIALFAERGYAATGIRDIARAVGVTTASLYHYIANKHQLLVDIMSVGLNSLTDFALESISDVRRPEDQLALLVGGLVGVHATNRLIARVVDAEVRALEDDVDALAMVIAQRDRYESVWANVLRNGLNEGVFTFEDERLTRLALLSACTGMSNWYKPAGDENLRVICRHMTEFALHAVKASRGGAPITVGDVRMIDLDRLPRMAWEPNYRPSSSARVKRTGA